MEWWDSVGISLMEGFGQTEAMSLIISREGARRLGSLAKLLPVLISRSPRKAS